MKRNYAMFLTSLLACGAMAQWQHMGLEGYSSTTGGVQVLDGSIYFHSAENSGTIYRSDDEGATWNPLQFATDGQSWKYRSFKRFQYVNHGTREAGPQGIYRKDTVTDEKVDLNWVITNFEMMDDGRLVASTGIGGANSIILSDQNGDAWVPGFPSGPDVHARLIGRDGQGRLLVQAFAENVQNDQDVGLFRSSDSGDSWERISDVKHDLAGASSNGDHSIYATNGLRILKSPDDGEKWSVLSVDFPYLGLTGSRIFNMGGGHLFFMCHEEGATTQGNLYQSLDHGTSWSPVEEEISQHLIFNMARDASGHVYAATNNGVYRLNSVEAVSIRDTAPAVTIHAYPVPTPDKVVVNAGGAMITELRMYDASSREVLFKPNVDKPAELLRVGHLSPGVYIVRAVTGKGIATTNVVVE
ncbi:MAG: T9SS type A sorting domain-containing protein [Flavobacteriales bacterium]|nr:T9SS type A sorting domain-containing protein [Flavobacteriales bacterium]MCB0759180.1 T9SS type A sorting domain-containing protein [Flavobacteriales bacterium]